MDMNEWRGFFTVVTVSFSGADYVRARHSLETQQIMRSELNLIGINYCKFYRKYSFQLLFYSP